MQLRSNFQVGQDTDIGGQSPLPVWFANQLFGWHQDSGWPGYVSKYDCRCDFDYASAIDIVSGADAQAGRRIIYGIVIIAMSLLYGWERIEQ